MVQDADTFGTVHMLRKDAPGRWRIQGLIAGFEPQTNHFKISTDWRTTVPITDSNL